jgi:hypothetical protein
MSKSLKADDVLTEIRAFYDKFKRVPKERDLNGSFRAAATKHFSSFDAATKAAFERHHYSDGEILAVIRNLYDKLGRFPETEDLQTVKRSFHITVYERFGGHICIALEKALGKSPCRQIVQAIDRLTPAGVDVATSAEILAEIEKVGMKFSGAQLAVHLKHLADQGFCSSGHVDKNTSWKLTPFGRSRMPAGVSRG